VLIHVSDGLIVALAPGRLIFRSQRVPAQSIGSILWFDPRREHSSARLSAAARRACQGWPRLSRPPEGLGLDWPEHGGILNRIGAAGVATWQEIQTGWLFG
jgi:hypothetical protein